MQERLGGANIAYFAERVIFSMPLEFGKDFCNRRVCLLLDSVARVDSDIGFNWEWYS